MLRQCAIAVFAAAVCGSVCPGVLRAAPEAGAPVTLTGDDNTYTLANGIVTAKIDKRSADVVSFQYKGLELLGSGSGHPFAYWSLPGTSMGFGSKRASTVRVDPAKNGGSRAIVSCKFAYDGRNGTAPADAEFCYTLGRGDQALYVQGNWEHKPEYPTLSFPVGRFALKLNKDVFDFMTIDARRRKVMPTPEDWNKGVELNMKEARRLTTGLYAGEVEHKYDYSAVQFDTPAYGWSSTRHHVGLWMINPSFEYMSGGPTKLELIAHLDANEQGGSPTILEVWKGPHYGGTVLSVAQGESWIKCIGPFLLYCNSAPDHEQMWKDALAKAANEARAWPYDWVNEPTFYTPKEQRSTVTGQLILNDPLARNSGMNNLLVGLAAPDWGTRGEQGGGQLVDWQRDGKYYQFWVRGDNQGHFTIPKVRPGTYTLHAIADGVLGEYAKTNITVESGKTIDLGKLEWTPVRYGKQLWDIGIADRTAGEFLHGDHYWVWGLYSQYRKDFPNDVNFVIGKSDYHKDWNIMQVPRAHDDSGRGRGDSTTWTVTFDLPHAPHGKATLRLAFAGTEARSLSVTMNDKPAGTITGLQNNMAIHRDSDRGYWLEKSVTFDASLMKAGINVLKLIVPAGPVTAGIEYDYIRLELDESASSPKIN
jgi:rhamnogalacturonan endolyase